MDLQKLPPSDREFLHEKWLSDPVTKDFVKFIVDQRDDVKQRLFGHVANHCNDLTKVMITLTQWRDLERMLEYVRTNRNT